MLDPRGVSHPRFSLLTLLVGLAVAALLFAGVERLTYRHVGRGQHATRLVPIDEDELIPQLHAWMTAQGFRRTTDVPPEVQGVDNFGTPYGNFYVGSYQGSAPFYVSIDPNWANDDNRSPERMSNILIYTGINFTGRIWDVNQSIAKFAAFLHDFHKWCDGLSEAGMPQRNSDKLGS